jgi:hypothetical protein
MITSINTESMTLRTPTNKKTLAKTKLNVYPFTSFFKNIETLPKRADSSPKTKNSGEQALRLRSYNKQVCLQEAVTPFYVSN